MGVEFIVCRSLADRSPSETMQTRRLIDTDGVIRCLLWIGIFRWLVIAGATRWPGRMCCELAWSRDCRNACNRARARDDVTSTCLAEREPALVTCLDRQDASERCCSLDTSPRCLALCKVIFMSDPAASVSQQRNLHNLCRVDVISCIHNSTHGAAPLSHPAESLPCCEKASTPECRERCRHALRTLPNDEQVADEITKHCGPPLPTDPMWKCFLTRSSNSVRHQHQRDGAIASGTGVDGVKLLCCEKAVTQRCGELCLRTYGGRWLTSWREFHQQCGDHPREQQLNACLLDVELPCKLGCSGLNYCANFNRRPTELFRSCHIEADSQARHDVQMWYSGALSLPLLQDLPVKDIQKCHPMMWRAIACSIHIRPCDSRTHATKICKADCVKILSDCVDGTRLPEGSTIKSVCTTLSAEQESDACISLAHYLTASVETAADDEVSQPCRPPRCGDDQVCLVQRHRCRRHNQHQRSKPTCRPYTCVPGCPLGDMSSFRVARGTFVRIPVASSRDPLLCHRVCRCGHQGALHRCRDLQCVTPKHCLLSSGRIQDHDSHFQLDCNDCYCTAGGVRVCTRRYCPQAGGSWRQHTGLPCNCASQYIPVCGQNGQTFASRCLARCAGLRESQFEVGPCFLREPCFVHPCKRTEMCVAKRQICLGDMTINCPQYQCVGMTTSCTNRPEPVCDSQGQEVRSMCELLSMNRQLAYRGRCMLSPCRLSGSVCGVNGETYANECAALADLVAVDYAGDCRQVGTLHKEGGATYQSSCADVECDVNHDYCQPINLPGACCPICAGVIRILFSQSEVSEAAEAAGKGHLTVYDLVEVVSRHVSTRQCNAFGYVSIEADLVVVVKPISENATVLQMRTCLAEAERLGSLIHSSSPILTTHLTASLFLTATTQLPHLTSTSRASQAGGFAVAFIVTAVHFAAFR